MSFNVKIQPSNIEFSIENNESILNSAINSNVHLEHSCMNGSCGTCKAKVIKGNVEHTITPEGLSETEIKEGYVLTCCAQVSTDVELLANYYPELSSIKRMIQPCKVEELSFPISDVAILKLKLPPTTNFEFLAGQYIQLIINGKRRSYSIANIQETYTGVELHVRKVNGGLFSEYVFNELKLNQLLRLEGPMGSFFVHESDEPIIFLAGGTGFAPIKSMVEQLIRDKTQREIYIYWGASTASGFYSDEATKWQDRYKNINYIPVLSGDETYSGKKGLVHKAVLGDFNDLENYVVYACGSPVMIDVARRDFIESGLKVNSFYSDAFVSSDK